MAKQIRVNSVICNCPCNCTKDASNCHEPCYQTETSFVVKTVQGGSPTYAVVTTADPTYTIFGLCRCNWGIFVLVGDLFTVQRVPYQLKNLPLARVDSTVPLTQISRRTETLCNSCYFVLYSCQWRCKTNSAGKTTIPMLVVVVHCGCCCHVLLCKIQVRPHYCINVFLLYLSSCVKFRWEVLLLESHWLLSRKNFHSYL